MLVDYKAAKNSKINFIHAKYGYGKNYSYYKYSINKYLQYYTHCIVTYSENNQKYILSCINYNSNSCGSSYSLYKYNLKKYMDDLFDKTIKIILNNYINSKKKCIK